MKQNSFLSQLRNFFGIIFIFAVLIFSLNLIYRLLFEPTIVLNEENKKVAEVITDFSKDIFNDSNFYSLEDGSLIQHTFQEDGTPYFKENPLPPNNVFVVDPKTGEEIIIFWSESIGSGKNIRIYRSEKSGGDSIMIADGLPLEGEYHDREVENNKNYYYLVKSVNNIGEGEYISRNTAQIVGQATDLTAPLAPENIKVSSTGKSGELHISWEKPLNEDFAFVRIYRSEVHGDIGTLVSEADEESYVDSDLSDGKIYYYTLTSVDSSHNESTRSLPKSIPGNSSPFYVPSPVNTNTNTNASS